MIAKALVSFSTITAISDDSFGHRHFSSHCTAVGQLISSWDKDEFLGDSHCSFSVDADVGSKVQCPNEHQTAKPGERRKSKCPQGKSGESLGCHAAFGRHGMLAKFYYGPRREMSFAGTGWD